jgi:hypothetical protein
MDPAQAPVGEPNTRSVRSRRSPPSSAAGNTSRRNNIIDETARYYQIKS